ncbi:MAG: hypothetical protein ACPGSD_07620 [Flavobacteriales bacterium]
MSEQKSKNNQLKTAIGVIVGILTYFLVNHFLFAPPSFDKVLMTTASELNKSLPLMVDRDTQLDNTIALPNNVFQYHYTLINSVIDKIEIKKMEEFLEEQLLNNIKSNPDLKTFRDNNVTMNYSYKDKNGEFITKISITPDEYK